MDEIFLIDAESLYALQAFLGTLDASGSRAGASPRSMELDPFEQRPVQELGPVIAALQSHETDIPIIWCAAAFACEHANNVMSLRVANATTIQDGFNVWEECAELMTNAILVAQTHQKNGDTILTYTALKVGDPCVSFLMRWIVAVTLYRLLRTYEGGIHFDRIEPRASSFDALVEHIDGTIDFVDVQLTRSDATFKLSHAVMTARLPGHIPRINQAMEIELRRHLAAIPKQRTLAARIRQHILNHNAFDISQDGICAVLQIEGRTLRRRLKAEGVSFTQLVRDLRCERAIHLVGETDIALKRIASDLAFRSDASFNMAFKQWTGMPPRAFRRGRAGPGRNDEPGG